MSEGPEPQELVEKVVHNHEHAESDTFTFRAALIASVLAVIAALTSILAGHTINSAILKQIDATNAWATYQSDTTKANVYEASKFIVQSVGDDGKQNSKLIEIVDELGRKADKYAKMKIIEGVDAKNMSKASHLELKRHQQYSMALACFQIGIILTSISIIVKRHLLYVLGIVCGLIGSVFVYFGYTI